ncbi:hypothetical protein P280DRAFT_514539 [Massarina eburnea CBS 473.64]|uniref:Uncharacterized protein n=1 Tax=Massarina eburnea CBS 473.64 TaxID=1395130 RepID=A0A6A6SB61_9PLEO|nr:hypothetical protein P280DRAFT_514539 [Massarina eburnea CBS 473.64]
MAAQVPQFVPNPIQMPWKVPPAQYIPSIPGTLWKGGWIQDGEVRRVKKPHYHWIWPKDGRQGSKLGRVKELLQGKGPDMHIAISADKMDYMHNRQRRAKWGNHLNIDGNQGPETLSAPWWVGSGIVGGRDNRLKYDYWTSKYVKPYEGMWTDAIWQGPNRKTPWPEQYRDVYGYWWMDIA